MVPFIDVMLVLLIIFMVTAPLITPSVIDLPSVGKASRQPDQIIQVTLTKTESLEVKVKEKTSSVALKDLAATVKQAQGTGDGAAPANSAVVISADKNVKYESGAGGGAGDWRGLETRTPSRHGRGGTVVCDSARGGSPAAAGRATRA